MSKFNNDEKIVRIFIFSLSDKKYILKLLLKPRKPQGKGTLFRNIQNRYICR
jgi:hypothetical protein